MCSTGYDNYNNIRQKYTAQVVFNQPPQICLSKIKEYKIILVVYYGEKKVRSEESQWKRDYIIGVTVSADGCNGKYREKSPHPPGVLWKKFGMTKICDFPYPFCVLPFMTKIAIFSTLFLNRPFK